MKNNTKLIMETWRRFLSEGPEGIDADGMVLDPNEDIDASDLPPVEDPDLMGDIEIIDQEMDMYGDPAKMGRDSSAPMLSDNDLDYDMTDSTTYMSDPDSLKTGDEMPDDSGSFEDSLDRYDPMDDMEDDLDYDSQSVSDDYRDYYKK